MERPSPKQIAYWYRRVRQKDPSWVDIEGGRDLSLIEGATTFTGGDERRVRISSASNILDYVEDYQRSFTSAGTFALADHPRSLRWRAISQAAHDLPPYEPDRDFLILAAQGDVKQAAVACQLPRMSAHRRWRKFLSSLKLPITTYEEVEAPPLASLARRLSKQERRQLEKRLAPPPGPRRVYTKAEARAETRRRLREKARG